MEVRSPRPSSASRAESRAIASATVWITLCVAVLLSVTFFSTVSSEAQSACPEGQILSDDGQTCELDVGQRDGDPAVCPPGQQLDEVGFCVEIPDGSNECPLGQRRVSPDGPCEIVEGSGGVLLDCPAGEQPDSFGISCEPIPGAVDVGCDDGFSLGADGVTCVADGPRCANDEILNDDGECQRYFQCPAGSVLQSDLLTCFSGGCPDNEVVSVDGKRCLAAETDCPDGSPRPVSGSCLVVETVERDGETEVVVRCDEADAYCQAQVKECAERRAAGDVDDDESDSCEDPRTACEDDEETCAEANDRLVECAVRDDEGDGEGEGSDGDGEDTEDAGPRRLDPCDDLCPPLHRLDPSGACIEFLDPRHPCVSFGQIPEGVTTNAELNGFSYLAGTGQCVTKVEFLRRLGNFEAAAGAEADALALLRETTSEYLSVEEQLAELNAGLITAEADVRDLTDAAAEADLRRARNEKSLFEARKVLQRERRLLEIEVLDVYVTGGGDAATESALIAAENLNTVGIVQSYGEILLDDQIDNIGRIESLESQTLALGVQLEESVAEVESSLDAAIEAAEQVEALLLATEQLREEQLDRRNEEAELVAELRENKGQFAQELGIFDQASREIADIISESEFLVTEFEDFDGVFAKPVIPAFVVSGFGPRLHPILGYVRNHDGLDFDANFGDPIYASAPGIVQIASSFGGYGETVVIDHGAGLLTLYAHMSVIGAEVGEEIKRGDVIGFIGSTGLSTGPHLHFEVWVEGRTAVDPMLYLTDLD
ncbi:MAG: peptidoglycan DD-metalloendopeptidase family protein [Actinomycetota bacterium]